MHAVATYYTDKATKFALPSPFLIAVRYWHEDFSRDAYPTLQHFLHHLAEILAREAGAAQTGQDDPAVEKRQPGGDPPRQVAALRRRVQLGTSPPSTL